MNNKCLINTHLIFFVLLFSRKIMIAWIKFKARMFCLWWIYYYHYKSCVQRVKVVWLVSYPNSPCLMKLFCFFKMHLISNKEDWKINTHLAVLI